MKKVYQPLLGTCVPLSSRTLATYPSREARYLVDITGLCLHQSPSLDGTHVAILVLVQLFLRFTTLFVLTFVCVSVQQIEVVDAQRIRVKAAKPGKVKKARVTRSSSKHSKLAPRKKSVTKPFVFSQASQTLRKSSQSKQTLALVKKATRDSARPGAKGSKQHAKPVLATRATKVKQLLKHRDKVREFQKLYKGERQEVLAGQAADPHIQSVMRHSESNGAYHIMSDMHWGLGRTEKGKKWDPKEDFRRSTTFAKFVSHVAKDKRSTSLIIGGDWLELMEHVNANAPVAEVKRTITKIIEGHQIETKALAKGIVKGGLRLIYIAGNHDVHLVNSEVRAHLTKEMARVGGLKGRAAKTFAERIAYSGHGAVLGKYGEGMVVHGHAQDSANNWRSVVNPYNAARQLQGNLGWSIVAKIFRKVETKHAEIDNIGSSSTRSVAMKVLTSPRYLASAMSVIWELLGGTRHFGKSGNLSERLDDRVTMKSWDKRTGFSKKMQSPIPGATVRPQNSYAKTFESIYQGAPSPMHERMKTPSRLVNFLVTIATSWSSARKTKASEPTILGRMTTELTNVRYVVWGHNHEEAVVTGDSAKGKLAHYNAGTWTKVDSQWRLNVVSGRTGKNGRLEMDGVFRTNKKTGAPNLPNHYSASEARPVPLWGQ